MYWQTEMQRCGQDRETARRQERKREQEMLRFPLDVRCVSVPGMLPLFPALGIGDRKGKKSALWRHLRLQMLTDDNTGNNLWIIIVFTLFL